MEINCTDDTFNDRLQGLLNGIAKCKIEFLNEKEEFKKVKEINSKLEVELKEARKLEKSHRYHLVSSREMIGNLQETVSQLVYLKRDVKKLKDEVIGKEISIASLEKDKENMVLKHNENIMELRNAHEKQLDEVSASSERNIQMMQQDSDTQIAQLTCLVEELRSKIRELEMEHRDKMNIVVLEYEEKLQRGVSQVAQLQEQLSRQSARTEANIDAYRRRLEELEEKLKQSEFKQYLAQTNYPSQSQYESQVERPYSVSKDIYDSNPEMNPVLETSKVKNFVITQNKTPKTQNTLQVTYSGNKNTNMTKYNEKKGGFNITKKRKLYNEKDYQDF